MFNYKISEADKQEIKVLLEQHNTYQAIANKYNCSKERIRQIARSFGLQGARLAAKKRDRNIQYEKRMQNLYGNFYTDGTVTEQERLTACKEKFRIKKYRVLHDSSALWDLNFSDLDWPDTCPVLGIKLNYFAKNREEASPSFDRIDPNKGYIKGNVIIMSWRANRLKNDGTLEEHQKIVDFLQKTQL